MWKSGIFLFIFTAAVGCSKPADTSSPGPGSLTLAIPPSPTPTPTPSPTPYILARPIIKHRVQTDDLPPAPELPRLGLPNGVAPVLVAIPQPEAPPEPAVPMRTQDPQTEIPKAPPAPDSPVAGAVAKKAAPKAKDPAIYSFGIDLRDIIRYKAPYAPEARAILQDMKASPGSYLPANVKFSEAGPGFKKGTRTNSVYGVEFVDLQREGTGLITAVIRVLIQVRDVGAAFRTFSIDLNDSPLTVKKVKLEQEVPLSATHFRLHVGLMQRKMILEDDENHIRKIYPIGLGGFDELTDSTKVKSLSPRFKHAYLEKKWAEASRTDPEYYRARPFIRLSTEKFAYTSFGFHYSIDPVLLRGFVSHGCFRMRDRDLYELFLIVKNQGNDKVPVEMRYWDQDPSDTPYPLIENSYARVKNFGTKEKPESRTDNHNLIIMETRRMKPPTDQFKDQLFSTPDLSGIMKFMNSL